MKRIVVLSLFSVYLLFMACGCASKSPSIVKEAGSKDISTSQTLHTEARNINAVDESGMTPLAYAVWQIRDINAVRHLIKKGADVNAKDSEGLTVLELALCTDRIDIINELVNAGARFVEPEAGKARLFFIGEGLLLRDTWVSVGDLHKNLKNGRMDFINVRPGSHKIVIPVSWYQTQPEMTINVEAGRIYYFIISPTGSHVASTALGFGIFPAIIADRTRGTGPFVISPVEESAAKEKIKVLLQTTKSLEVR